MSPPLDNFDLGEMPPPPEPAAPMAPKVFVRTLSTPPGLPWEQTKAADLEARHGAPMPLNDVALQLRRLEPWRPGQAGRFAALYVPARAVGDRLDATVTIDGAPVEVVFLSARAKAAQRQRVLLVGGGAAVAVALVVATVGSAISRRQTAELLLDNAETLAASRTRAADAEQRQREQARALEIAPERGAPVSTVLADLAWLSSAKAPDSRVEAFHWEGGAMALEVRGERSPLVAQGARSVERTSKPIRRGVWLWLISTPDRDSGVARPVVAEPRTEKRR